MCTLHYFFISLKHLLGLAISPNNNQVNIYTKVGNVGKENINSNSSNNLSKEWQLETTLQEHDLRVSAIDWAPETNKIVTCSADRNAYVWNQEPDGTWKPTLVSMRITRAATCVRWARNEKKFAAGSGAKLISLCHYDECDGWWISKHIKKSIKSSITCIDWHPDNCLLAAGSTDYRVRVYSGYIKEVDGPEPASNNWQSKSTSSGGLITEFTAGSWIHGLSFSPSGNRLAWISHDSCISVADVLVPTASSNSKTAVVTLKTRYLPCLSVVWSSEVNLVAAGHDCYPMLYKYERGSNVASNTAPLTYLGKMDQSGKEKEADGFSAMKKFRDMDRRGIENHTGPGEGGGALESIHQNTIVEVRNYSKDKVSTVGLDGKVVVWKVN